MPSRKPSRYTRRPKSNYMWMQDNLATETTLSQNGQAISELCSPLDPNHHVGYTVMRQIGTWGIKAATADVDIQVMFGILLLREDEFNAAALPEMQLDDPKWLRLETLMHRTEALSGTNVWKHSDFDSKSRRKFQTRESRLALLVENISNTAVDIVFNWAVRTLLRV